MGALGIWHWVVVLAIVLVLFGKGKISGLLGEFGNGIRAFKKGVSEETTSDDGVNENINKKTEHA